MDADERAIYYYLKSRRPKAAPLHEISRYVGGKRKFREVPDWAQPVLQRLLERGILENDEAGHYRLKPIPRTDTRGKSWACPQMAEVLKASGKSFENLITETDEDEYYTNL